MIVTQKTDVQRNHGMILVEARKMNAHNAMPRYGNVGLSVL
jgi:hypothetical protein